MATYTVTPNMSLIVPTVGLEPGPQFATDVNNSLTILDQHNHSAGSGVQITPSGLNINSALPMGGNILTLTGAISFEAQTADAGVGTLYEKGVDLYFEDGSGNVIRITQSGSLAGAAGTITGLPSGTASAAYVSGTFVFQSATNTAANIDAASYIYRNNTANSFGVTLSPPNALASSYALFLPTIPAQTNVMTLDASGNMGSITYDQVGQDMSAVGANAIAASMTSTGTNSIIATMGSSGANQLEANRTTTTGTSVGLNGLAISNSSGSYSTTSSSYTPVTNLSVTLSTSGRPVLLKLEPYTGGAGNSAYCVVSNGGNGFMAFFVNGTQLSSDMLFSSPTGAEYISASFSSTHIAGASTYTYDVRAYAASGFISVYNYRLVAYEL